MPSPPTAQNALLPRQGTTPLGGVDLAIGGVLALIALLLRLKDIGAPSLWVDEAASLTFSRMSWSNLFTTLPLIETNPPVYYALLKAWTSLVGTSETALRMPGAIAGALSVLALFFVVRRAYGRTAACVATAFLALSAVQISYAQEVRAFPWMTLLFVIGLGAAQDLVRRINDQRPTAAILLVLGAVTAGFPYVHYSGFFVAIVLVSYVVVLLLLHGYLGTVAVRLGALGVLTLIMALVPIFWALDVMSQGDSPVGWLRAPTVADAQYIFHQAFGHKYLAFGKPSWLPAEAPDSTATRLLAARRLAELSLGLICTLGVLISLRRKDWGIPAMAITFCTVLVVFFGVSQKKPILIERTIIFAIPMIAVIAGYSVSRLKLAYFILPAGLSVVAFQTANLVAYYPKAEKEPWRTMFERVETAYRDGNAIIFTSSPYLSATISTTVLAEYYWNDLPKQNAFSLPSKNTGQIHELGLSLAHWVQVLDLETTCRQLSETTGVLVVFRDEEETKALAQKLIALDSKILTRTQIGRVGFELWSPLSCT